MIPLSEPKISGNEWKYIKECLDTGWVSSAGDFVTRFEEIVAKYIGTKYGVATVNGTSALHVSLIASGVLPEEEVIVPTLSFIAPVNVIRYCNAFPVFMDCDPITLCLDVEKVSEFLTSECIFRNGYTFNKSTNRKILALIPVHIFGHPVDMEPLLEIGEKNNIIIIEDATESFGSEYKGRKTGGFGKLNCLSFNGNKIITTGGGGMVITDFKELAEKVRHLTTQAKTDTIEYDHDDIGYNYRLTNIQAAMGVAQMENIERFISLKRKNSILYRELLSDISEVEFLQEKLWAKSNYWFYTILVPKKHKNPLLEYLLSKSIQVRPIWKLIHTLPMYKDFQSYAIDKALAVYESCINLPCSVSIKQEEIEYVTDCIQNYFKN